jgi:alkylation response protein AidB-like acyl-CoA dehydrogenase
MDFELSEEQRMLRESLSRLLADRYDFAQRNRYRRSEAGYDPAIWQAYADMGLLALNVHQVHGGLEAGAGETFIVMSEIGQGPDGGAVPAYLRDGTGTAQGWRR